MVLRVSTLISLVLFWCGSAGAEEQCGRAVLQQIVAQASKALTIMNKDKTASFQQRLRDLKQKRGWDDKQLLQNAKPIVQNDAVAAFDNRTRQIYAEITKLGSEAAKPDCNMRDRLNELLAQLVQNNVEKWALITDTTEAELAK